MSFNESYAPGYEAERTPSPPPLPPLPSEEPALPVSWTPPPLPALPTVDKTASPDHIVLSLEDDSSAASEDEVEPGSPLPPPFSPLPPADHHALTTPPSLPAAYNRSWATLPTPMLVSSVLATPTTPDSAPQHLHHSDDRDGRYVTHRPLPIHTVAGAHKPTIHHSLNPPQSDYSAASGASASPGGVSPAIAEEGPFDDSRPLPPLRFSDSLETHTLKTPTSGGEAEQVAGGVDVLTVKIAEASDEYEEHKAGENREGSPLDDSTMRYGTAGSELNFQLSAIDAAPGEGKPIEEKEEKEADMSGESFHYSPQPLDPNTPQQSHSLHILTTANSDMAGTLGTLGTFNTMSEPSRMSDTIVPYQTMSHVSRISDTTVPYAATLLGDESAEYRYTYKAEQQGLIEQGRLSSNPLSPPPASPDYHLMQSPRSATASHPLAYHTLHSPTSPSAPDMPYQQTVSLMGPVSYSTAQMRPFSPSLNDASMRQEYKTGEIDVVVREDDEVVGERPVGGMAVMDDDEKQPGEALEPEVLAAIARLEAGEAAESDVVRISVDDAGNAILPAHSSELELQRYSSGVPVEYGSAAVVVGAGALVNGVAVDDGGEGINMRKEGQSTPIKAGSNRSSRAASKANKRSSRSSRSRAAAKAPTVRWPVFSAFFVTAIVIVFLLEFQYDNWVWDSLFENPMFGPQPSTLLHFGAKFTPALRLHGQHWRLISSILLHSGVIHLLFSLVVGFMYAYQFEREHGWWRVFPCWVISGVFGQLFSSLLSPQFVSVGGSGAVAGLVSGWVGDWLHSWNRIENRWMYAFRHFFCMCIVFTAGVFPFNDNYAALGGCACGIACGLVAYAPVHRKADLRWQLGDFGRWRVTGFRKAVLGVVLVCVMYGVVTGLLFGRSVDSLYGCENCHWVGCVDTPLWSCSAGIPSDCFDKTGHLTHKSTSPLC